MCLQYSLFVVLDFVIVSRFPMCGPACQTTRRRHPSQRITKIFRKRFRSSKLVQTPEIVILSGGGFFCRRSRRTPIRPAILTRWQPRRRQTCSLSRPDRQPARFKVAKIYPRANITPAMDSAFSPRGKTAGNPRPSRFLHLQTLPINLKQKSAGSHRNLPAIDGEWCFCLQSSHRC